MKKNPSSTKFNCAVNNLSYLSQENQIKYFLVLLENVQSIILRLKGFVTTVKKMNSFSEKHSGTEIHRVNQNKQNPMNVL